MPVAALNPPIATLPPEFRNAFLQSWAELRSASRQAGFEIDDLPPEVIASLPRVLTCSSFFAKTCLRNPAWLLDLSKSAEVARSVLPSDDPTRLVPEFLGSFDEGGFMKALRKLRNRAMMHIAFLDIAGWNSVEDTLQVLSFLGVAVIRATQTVLFAQACNKAGISPGGADGIPPELVILAMGKLGAGELNFSSDVDLIFAYPIEGTLPDRKSTSFHEFYARLARSLVKVLDTVTEDGFVFRVDLRLRPFGDSGPLVLNFDALEAYYQGQAREWERYAMVKALPITGSSLAKKQLQDFLKPFVYRRYLDYRAFGELRQLKEKITQELRRRDRLDNIKLGPGGIREIEFIGQAFQLIRGGRDPSLQDRRILAVLGALGQRNYLPGSIVEKLQRAYRLLRTVENRLQQYDDQQTHELPREPLEQARLAYGMGYESWDSFKTHLDKIRRQVHEVFEQVMAAPHADDRASSGGHAGSQDSVEALKAMGYSNPGRIREHLVEFDASHSVRKLTRKGREELERLMPLLLQAVAQFDPSDVALQRILPLLEAVASRSVYFALLAENPLALSQLVKLSTVSPWIIRYISQFPVLLDELLDPRSLYTPLTRECLEAELARLLAAVDSGDLEQWLGVLCQFKQSNVLKVASADVAGIVPIMVVSDRLSDIAQVIIAEALRQAWRLTGLRHGVPTGAPSEEGAGFAVIAYGKLGGIELGYGSDLDLVFLHEQSDSGAVTNGCNPISVSEFYAKLAKRLVNLLTTRTYAGTLYDVDLRLRPSGNSGLLVSSLAAYEHYQMNAAWTWEQQALVRARYVAGDPAVGQCFGRIRDQALRRFRDADALRGEVRAMRAKMRQNLAAKDPHVFDLKQGVGGIADIEFIVQFLVLAHARTYPELTVWTDTVRLLESLAAAHLLADEDAQLLKNAYCHFRELAHRSALREVPAEVSAEDEPDLPVQVGRVWRRVMENSSVR